MFYPRALARTLGKMAEIDLRAAATLGASDSETEATLRMTKQAFADEFGVALYDEPEEMIEAEGLDAVAVATRHTEHADYVERAAARGVHVFVCKTMATTSADAERIVAAGRENGVRVAIGPGGRMQPHHAAAREIIDSGRIGAPVSLRVSHNHGTIDSLGPDDWYREKAEGGPELSLGWYVVDTLRFLAKGRVVRVYAEYGNFASPDSPFMDQGKIVLRFEDGVIASGDLYFSNRFPFPTWDLEVVGVSGALRTHSAAGADGIPDGLLWTGEGVERIEVPKGSLWDLDVAAWTRAFAEDKEPQINADEGKAITEICLACRESSESGRVVELS